ncbi:MAG TPA: glycoside hydrolase domain-containing protein [Candidatus Binatia bacterium]|jgi:hypothetical protein
MLSGPLLRPRRILIAILAVALAAAAAVVVDVGPRNLARMAWRRVQKSADRRNRWIEPDAATNPAPVTPEEKSRGFSVFTRSTLLRINAGDPPDTGETPAALHAQAAWNQREALQLGVHALRSINALTASPSDLHDDAGDVLPAAAIDVRMERFYSLALSIKVHNRFGVVPKTLEPAVSIAAPSGSTRPFWLTVHVPDAQPAGLYRGTVSVTADSSTVEVPIDVDVLGLALDEAPILLGPLSLPVLRNFSRSGLERGGEIARRADLIFRDIRDHGMTTLSLWSGRASRRERGRLVLPDLEMAMEMFRRDGFPQPLLFAPVNLLFTNKLGRTANYRHYHSVTAVPMARDIATTYTARARELGLPGLILDPVEEPNYALGLDRHDPPDLRQRIARELLAAMKEAGATTAMTCTPETASVGAGNLDYWLVAYKRFTPGVFDKARKAGAHAAMYNNATLTGNGTSFSRFFFGYYPWATGLDGMMAWTYPMIQKRFPANMDASRAEGPLDVRDGFLGRDGKPVPTIQWELAREGVDDARYLATIARLAASARSIGSPGATQAADEADRFFASLRASVGRDPHRYAFENPKTLAPARAVGWDWTDFEATRRRSFELARELAAVIGGPPAGRLSGLQPGTARLNASSRASR